MSELKYLSEKFQPEILEKIEEKTTSSFSICTAYTSLSMVNSMAGIPDFFDKLDSLLIGDPISLGFEGKREEITKVLQKKSMNRVFFANLGKYNIAKNTWSPIIHSKIYLGFDEAKNPIWAFLGSVNFSENGMNKHHESLVYISAKDTLLEINNHFKELKMLCATNKTLGLERFVIKHTNPPYYFQIVDNSNAMNNIHIIVVLIESDEVDGVKQAKAIRFDCFDSNALLYKSLKKGTECEFILIFTTGRPLRNSKNIVVKFAQTVASVNPQQTADHVSEYDGYIRYENGKTLVDWDENPPPSNTSKHQRGLKVLKPEREILFGNNKDLKLMMINQYINSDNGEALHLVLEKTSDQKRDSELDYPNPDNQEEILLNLSEIRLKPSESIKLSEKLDHADMEKIDGDQIHLEDKYSLKSQISESFIVGKERMKKDLKVSSYVVPKYFIGNSS